MDPVVVEMIMARLCELSPQYEDVRNRWLAVQEEAHTARKLLAEQVGKAAAEAFFSPYGDGPPTLDEIEAHLKTGKWPERS